jgi:hypothetical protein
MKWLLGGIAALLILVAGFVGVRAIVSSDPIYSVSQLDAALKTHPATVVGHVIRVRGVVGYCPIRAGCPQNVPPIFAAHLGTISPDPPLQLEFGTSDSLTGKLRGFPLLGALIPPPQHLIDGFQGVLRVRIEVAPPYDCFEALCFRGVLQDVVAR